ncbi:MAG TPA: response regulator, partial [Thermoanaerobaculia bacterium]
MALAQPASLVERDVVLAVDDNDQNLQLIEEYLWQWGYDVVVARDGREALRLFPQHNPSLILLDVMMPIMDGYGACSRIKATPQGRRIPIVMLTALTGIEDKIRALESGADDFLNKPINKEELRARLRSLIRIRNLRREIDSIENIIVTLTSALENKDPRSGGHIQRVASYAAHLCDRLGMSLGDREAILKGALLHDLGMIGIPDEILMKTDPYTDEEKHRLEEHAAMGASILEPMKTFQQFVPMVRWHHERLDGSGYPDGLAGDAIPLEAQIIGIANRFEEIRQEAFCAESEALIRLRQEANRGGFDVELVELFEKALRDEPIASGPPRMLTLQRSAPHPRILCVDDSKLNRELITATLSEVGLEVLHAENGAEALEIIAIRQIELVLLDLLM